MFIRDKCACAKKQLLICCVFYGPPMYAANRWAVACLQPEKKIHFINTSSFLLWFSAWFPSETWFTRPCTMQCPHGARTIGEFYLGAPELGAAQPHHQQLPPRLDLGSAVPLLLTDASKPFPLPHLSPRVVGRLIPRGSLCVSYMGSWGTGCPTKASVLA